MSSIETQLKELTIPWKFAVIVVAMTVSASSISVITGCHDPKALELAKRYGHLRLNSGKPFEVRLFGDNSQHAADQLIPHLRDLGGLKRLTVAVNGNLPDAHLRVIGELEDLEHLSLSSCEIDDHGLQHLAGLTNLKELNLSFNPIRGHGLKHLADMHKLAVLEIFQTEISGAGLKHLPPLKQLELLDVSGTDVDNEGLSYIANMPKCRIRRLKLRGTAVTAEGMMELVCLHWLEQVGIPGTETMWLGEIMNKQGRRNAFRRRPSG